jgi:hypothetical protein
MDSSKVKQVPFIASASMDIMPLKKIPWTGFLKRKAMPTMGIKKASDCFCP